MEKEKVNINSSRRKTKDHHSTTITFHGAAGVVTPSASTLTQRTKEETFRIMTDTGSVIRDETEDAQTMR